MNPRHRTGRALILAAATAASAAALWTMLPAGWADYQTMKTRWQLGLWTSGKAPPPGIVEWGNAVNRLTDGLKTTPQDPTLHEGIAWLYASRAIASEAFPELATPYMQQAAQSYQTAANLRPMSGPTWAHLALALHSLNDPASTPQLWQATDKALQYGPREPAVQTALARIGFSRWSQLPEPTRAAFTHMLGQVQPHHHATIKAIAQQHQLTHLLPATAAAP